jgi:TolB-like protein/DNA-binding winged helix-turn-helix (wHTH) protein/Tfp pilus assembly protein PilF
MKYVVGDLSIDCGPQSVSRAGVVIALPKLSYDLFLVLIRAAPDVVSLDELMRQVWRDVVVSPDTVGKRVMLLRAALGDDPSAPRYIAALRGRGYHIIAQVCALTEVIPAPLATDGHGAANPVPPAGKDMASAPSATNDVIDSDYAAQKASKSQSPLRLGNFLKPGFLTILLGTAIGVGVFWKFHSAWGPAPVVPSSLGDRSIAVLPFLDLSEKKDQEYLSDGMAEEILDLLTKIPGLTVIGRTSSFQFKGKNEDLRTIGMKLNAAYILEGSVRKSDDLVRIAAQLINTRTGAHEWSETFDRPVGDVFKLQDAIAAAVVRKLQLTVAPGYLKPRAVEKNLDAYELTLHGLNALDRYDKNGFDEAAIFFQRAIDRDPTSADAIALLALNYKMQGEYGFEAPTEAFEQARRLAVKALALDAKSVWAHHVLAGVHTYYDWDWAAAEREVQQVATLAPGSGDAAYLAGMLSIALGRWDEALRQITAVLAQEPLDAGIYLDLSIVQDLRGSLPEAEAAARRVLEIHPTYAWGHFYLGIVLLRRGEHAAALVEMNQETMTEAKRQGLAMAYYALGRKSDSDMALAEEIQQDANDNAFGIAETYAYRGQADDAFRWLERAYVQKDSGLKYVKTNRALHSLAGDRRFQSFLRKMNLPM